MPRTRLRTLASWAGAVALLALFATPAAAAIASVPVAIGADGGVLVMAEGDNPNLDSTLDFSVLRQWANATATLHNSASFDIGAMITNLSRSTGTSWMMQGAATLWGLLQGLYDFALAFEPINGFGAGLDSLAAGLATIATSEIGIIGIIIALVAAIFGAVRATRMGGRGGLKRLVGIVVLFGVVGISGAGANASSGIGNDYKPGMFSPGWAITTTNAGINKLSTGLAGLVKADSLAGIGEITWSNGASAAPGETMTCVQYVDAMKAKAEGLGADLGSAEGTPVEQGQLSRDRAQLSFLLSDLWSLSGLESYKTVQFGSNVYADKAYCRMLETNAGVTEQQQMIKLDQSMTFANTKTVGTSQEVVDPKNLGKGMHLFSYDNSKNRMAGMTAWAACYTDNWGEEWKVDPAWAKEYMQDGKDEDSARISDKTCQDWWNGEGGTDPGDIPNVFDVDGTPDGIAKAVPGTSPDAVAIRDYLNTLNGAWTFGGGSASAAVYLLGALTTFIALGIVCVGTILAKLLGLFYALALMLVLIAGLFVPNGWNKVKQTTFQMIGSQIFAAGAVLILTFIVIFTQLIMTIGASLFERGSIWALLWMGLAPAMALIGFNFIFKKVFRLPSPMSIKGGQLFANAAAAGGGGLAGSMIGSMGRGDGDPVESGGRRLGRAAKESLQKFGTPQDPNKREGAMGGGKRRTKLAAAAAGDAAGAGAAVGSAATTGGAAVGAAAGAAGAGAGAAGGEAVTVPLGAPAAQGTMAEQVAALRHAKAEGKGGLAGATVLPAMAGAGLLRRGLGTAGKKALASHQAIRSGGGYKAAAVSAARRGKAGTLAAVQHNAKQLRIARNAQGQRVLRESNGIGAALERAREQRFQSLAASRGINLATATRTQLQEIRKDSTAGRMVNAAAKARGAKAIADSKAAIKAAPTRMKSAALAAPAKVASGAAKAYNNPKTMSRVKTAAKVGAGAAAIGLTGGLAAAPIAAFAAHKAIGKSRSYLSGTRKGEHQADRLQAYRDAHANAAASKKAEDDKSAATQAKTKEQRELAELIAEAVKGQREGDGKPEAKLEGGAGSSEPGREEARPNESDFGEN